MVDKHLLDFLRATTTVRRPVWVSQPTAPFGFHSQPEIGHVQENSQDARFTHTTYFRQAEQIIARRETKFFRV